MTHPTIRGSHPRSPFFSKNHRRLREVVAVGFGLSGAIAVVSSCVIVAAGVHAHEHDARQDRLVQEAIAAGSGAEADRLTAQAKSESHSENRSLGVFCLGVAALGGAMALYGAAIDAGELLRPPQQHNHLDLFAWQPQ